VPPRYRKNPQTAGRIVDGLAFVVTPGDSRLHTLNAAGTLLWRLAREADGVTVEAGARALTEHFEVDADTARRDVEACFADLVAREILIPDGDTPSGGRAG
jgi:hypothetical protein